MKKLNPDGFTIIEVLVAISLMLILMLVVLYPLLTSLKMTGQSKNNLQGTSDAQKNLETARQIVITNFNSGAKINALLSSYTGLTCENINLFNQVMAVSNCKDLDSPPLRRLTLTTRTAGSQTDDIVLKVTVSGLQ